MILFSRKPTAIQKVCNEPQRSTDRHFLQRTEVTHRFLYFSAEAQIAE